MRGIFGRRIRCFPAHVRPPEQRRWDGLQTGIDSDCANAHSPAPAAGRDALIYSHVTFTLWNVIINISNWITGDTCTSTRRELVFSLLFLSSASLRRHSSSSTCVWREELHCIVLYIHSGTKPFNIHISHAQKKYINNINILIVITLDYKTSKSCVTVYYFNFGLWFFNNHNKTGTFLSRYNLSLLLFMNYICYFTAVVLFKLWKVIIKIKNTWLLHI